MPVSPVNQRFTASARGLITEGNELSNIEHSNLAESNYELLHDGTRRRRRPVIEERADRSLHRNLDRGEAVSSHLWMTPGREENISITVEEVAGTIKFYWLDHENPSHIADFPLRQQLRLELWGTYNSDGDTDRRVPAFSSQHPSVYTEGNGSLYIFNRFTGTIRVDLVDPVLRTLRFIPVGTWIRDFQGIDEATDLYTRPRRNSNLTGYNGVPVLDSSFIDSIHEDLDNRRAYNLSNQGWPGRDLARFADESDDNYTVETGLWNNSTITYLDQPGRYPAFMDRYLDGRLLHEDGRDIFSTHQLLEARQRRSEPTKGARIGHSDFTSAGTLQPIPIKVEGRVTAAPIGNSIFVDVEFDEPFVHSIGRPVEDLAAFVHHMTFQVAQDGAPVEFVGGVSGVFDVVSITDDGRGMRFRVSNESYAEYFPFRLLSLYMHPAPVYTPHKVATAEGYDYRAGRRPTSGAWYAGRLWQFGDEHNRLYFSQLIPESSHGREDIDIARESLCYAANSPTDADDNAIVATDGGYVVVTDSGTHLQGAVFQSSLLVTTDNGIWEVRGNDRSGIFLPDSFSVRRLTKSEVLGHKAMVVMDTEVHVCTAEGIIRIFPDERTGILHTEVITHLSIKSEYDGLIREDREVVGAYDPDSRVVRWVFPLKNVYTSSADTSATPMLSWSLQHQAWFRYDFGFGAAISDMIVLPYTVVNPTYNRFRYLITSLNFLGVPSDLFVEWGIEADFSETGPNQWVDFHDPNALFADFLDVFTEPQERTAPEAFMLTAHNIMGEGMRWSHINYVTAFNRDVTTNWVPNIVDDDGTVLDYRANIEGSTLLQAQWDWFTQEGRGKHTNPQETYRYRRHFFPDVQTSETNPVARRAEDLLVSKQKVRGKGREFRLRWSSQDHRDSHIVGWAIEGLVQTAI